MGYVFASYNGLYARVNDFSTVVQKGGWGLFRLFPLMLDFALFATLVLVAIMLMVTGFRVRPNNPTPWVLSELLEGAVFVLYLVQLYIGLDLVRQGVLYLWGRVWPNIPYEITITSAYSLPRVAGSIAVLLILYFVTVLLKKRQHFI